MARLPGEGPSRPHGVESLIYLVEGEPRGKAAPPQEPQRDGWNNGEPDISTLEKTGHVGSTG